jgi:high affinity sulfate transporter 1
VAVARIPKRFSTWLPGLGVLLTYRRVWLRHDLVAGLVLTALLVPQGMAYAELAGLPPVTGLYATMLPLLAYAIFGPSRILVLGPDSAVAPLVAAAVLPLAASGSAEAVVLAGMLALFVGALCVAAGVARLGFITELLSKPVRVGYLLGIAATVIASQLPKLFGFSVDGDDFLSWLRGFFSDLAETNGAALAIGLACLAVIFGCRRWVRAVPGVFVAVVGATVSVTILGLDVPVLGELPKGLPSLDFPSVDAADLGRLAAAAAGIAFVSFADTSILSRSYASRLGDDVDQSRELVALGAANVASGLFQGFPISSSSSRTPVAESAGAKTQLTGVVGALCIGLLLLAGTGLVEDLPSSALAAVVIAAVTTLVDVPTLQRLRRVHRTDFGLAIACFAAVTLVGVLWGVAIAIGLSLLIFVRRAWAPHDAVLGRAEGVKGYHDVTRYPGARQVPGLLLYRFDAPLFFANANVFRGRVLHFVDRARVPIKLVVVAAEPITDVDSTAAEMLEELDGELARAGADLAFAELKDPVKDKLARFGLVERIGPERFYPTIGTAVHAYVDTSGVDWTDWEEAHAGGRDQAAADSPSL